MLTDIEDVLYNDKCCSSSSCISFMLSTISANIIVHLLFFMATSISALWNPNAGAGSREIRVFFNVFNAMQRLSMQLVPELACIAQRVVLTF